MVHCLDDFGRTLNIVSQDELAAIRQKLRYTLREMADRLSVTASRYKNWKYGKAQVPPGILQRAKALLNSDAPPGANIGNPLGAATELEVPVPYIGRVAASSIMDWTDPLEADLTEFVPVHMASRRGTFCAYVEGDSMTPFLLHGDMMIFRAEEFAQPGKIVVYRSELAGTVTVKQLKFGVDGAYLHPLNPRYKDEPCDGRVVGILVGIVRKMGTYTMTAHDDSGLTPGSN